MLVFYEEGARRNDGGGRNGGLRDPGSGIREDDLSRLFTSFTQLEDARTRRHEGTGLGLAITRELVSLLGGRIAVASTYGEGTTFTLYLPFKAASQKKEAT